jgi:predicted PurR-regulated permease PerM
MFLRWDKKYLRWGLTVFLTAAAIMLLYICVTNFSLVTGALHGITDAFMPVIYGFVFAYLLAPVMNFFEKKCYRPLFGRCFKKAAPYKITKAARISGAASAILVAVIFIAGLLSAVLPELLKTLSMLTDNMNSYIASAQNWVNNLLSGVPDIQVTVSDFLSDFTTNIINLIRDFIVPRMSDVVGSVSNGIFNTLSAVLNIAIGLIICVYLLYGKDLFAAQGKKILFGVFKTGTANSMLRVLRDVHKLFGGFIIGKLLDCFVVGAIFFLILTLLNMPYAILVSVLMAVCNFIPFFGPFIGAIPSCLLILLVDPWQMILFAILCLIIMQIDGNIIEPKLLGDNTGLSSFWVIFALLLGQQIFGIVGLIIGVPLFSFLYTMIRARVGKRLNDKALPDDTNIYRDVAYLKEREDETLPPEFITLSDIQLKEAEERAQPGGKQGIKSFAERFNRKKDKNGGKQKIQAKVEVKSKTIPDSPNKPATEEKPAAKTLPKSSGSKTVKGKVKTKKK